MRNTYDVRLSVEGWKSELAQMIEGAQTAEERVALEAFAQAMNPYFENPNKLRAQLGKIMMPSMNPAVQRALEEKSFSDIDDLKAFLPAGVEVRVEA